MTPTPDPPDHPPRVLIVDDEPHNRRLLQVMLKPEGYEVATAASGEEALAMVADQAPDVILLDIMMPGMDGYQVAEALKSNLTTRNIPVIMVTALNDREAKLLGLRAGAEDFLSKPVDRDELRVRVRNLSRLRASSEAEVGSRTADLVTRTHTLEEQAEVLTEQAALLDLAQDAIVVRDMGMRISFWNRGAELMYGWRSEDALGRNAYELLQAKFSEPTEDIENTLLERGRWEGEAIHHKRDGTALVVASRWALQRNADGVPVRILTINNDITSRKQADAERKKAEEALEQILREQMRFKDEFLSHVSHELRSPLTAIKQFTSILLRGSAGELNAEQREYQEIVLKNIRQLQSMIDDLLEVTRLETGKLTVKQESVSVARAVADAFYTLQGTALAKGVALSYDVPSSMPPARGDPTRLRQILIILLDNAVKFTMEGGAVTMQARWLPQDPGFVQLEVRDTGCGMSPEITERIFERLYQMPDRLHTSRKGLGLGLYICKELVTRLGGTIRVESEAGKGTAFVFSLPVFSLASLLVPLLENGRWPTDSVALFVVEIPKLGGVRSKDSQEDWSRDARDLLQSCVLPDLDLVLPKTNPAAGSEQFFIVAFADDTGASVLARRIREQFARITRLRQPAQAVSVSYSMLPHSPPDLRASAEDTVSRMAARIEESVNALIISEGIPS